MSPRYRITPEGREPLTDADIAKHRDAHRLFYQYHRATRPLYRKPLYKDRRMFIALVILALLAVLIAEVVDHERSLPPERTAPAPEHDGSHRP